MISKRVKLALIPMGAVALTSLLLLTTLDKKIFDAFLRTAPRLEEDPKVLLINVDDLAISNIGTFPWSRDVIADAIVFLKEMGAESLTFDLSYIDQSPLQVDQAYVEEELPGTVERSFAGLDEGIASVMDGVAAGRIGRAGAGAAKEGLLARSAAVKETVLEAVGQVSRDLDDYFGGNIRFFGSAYMTLTMVMPSDMLKGAEYDMSKVDLPRLEDGFSLKGLDLSRDSLSPRAVGISPTIPELLYASAGAGFVNVPVDADGKIRRVHLINTYQGKAYAHLVLASIRKRLGDPVLKITNRAVSLEGALLGGERVDIRIPRSKDGSVLINWPKKPYSEYNSISVWQLIKANELEGRIVSNLRAMQANGYFSYWQGEKSPLEAYGECEYIRSEMAAGAGPEDGLDHAVYAEYRQGFLDVTDEFLNGGTEAAILDAAAGDPVLAEAVRASFSMVRKQLSDLLEIRTNVRRRVEGAFCILGVDATSMTDVGMNAYQKRFPNVGTYAALANMILSRNFLDDAPDWLQILLALALAFGLTYLIYKMDLVKALITGALALAATIIFYLAFFMLTRCYLGLTVPFLALAICYVSISVINFLRTAREKSFLRNAFSRYLSPAVIHEIIQDPSKLNLGGESRVMTAIFTDIRGFSGISEKLTPTDLVKLLNLYLTAMSDIILQNRGTVDKYEGDAIIAFFGAPIRMDDHPAAACRTAVMMKEAEAEINARVSAEGLSPSPLFTRIGINTGEMVVGNMGTANQMNYTIMGHAVNLAARLEGVNKQYGTRGILVSEYTRAMIGEDFSLRRLDRVRVVGVTTPIRLFELLGFSSETDEAGRKAIAEWEKAIDIFESGDFKSAGDAFQTLATADPGDGVAALYAKRCLEYLASPPPADWDAVCNLTQK